MTIDEIELYDVEAVDEILSHLSDEDANVVQRAISSLCGMITIRDKSKGKDTTSWQHSRC